MTLYTAEIWLDEDNICNECPRHDCEAIERGKHNTFIGHGERGGLIFTCDKCKGEHVILEPQPLWVVESLAWGFCKEHADCEEKE